MKTKELNFKDIANDSGEKISVILAMNAFQKLSEDIEDIATSAERRDELTISHEQLITERKRDGLM